jgi:hypothetical protein
MARTIADFHNHLGPIYVEIDQDVTRVHAYWKLVTQLFGSQESVAILNNAAGFAIRAIQDCLIDSVILRITKLTDPAQAQRGQFPNLSFEYLIGKLPYDADAALRKRLRKQLNIIRKSTDNFRLIRDKRLAHRDTAYAIDSDQILPGITRKSIDDPLQRIRDFMHEIQRYYEFEGTVYQMVELGRDGDHLLFHLLCGKRFIELHEDVQLGKLTKDDGFQRIQELPKREPNTRDGP